MKIFRWIKSLFKRQKGVGIATWEVTTSDDLDPEETLCIWEPLDNNYYWGWCDGVLFQCEDDEPPAICPTCRLPVTLIREAPDEVN